LLAEAFWPVAVFPGVVEGYRAEDVALGFPFQLAG
jgi:hypothetical protein